MSDTRPRILALSPSLATRARGVLHELLVACAPAVEASSTTARGEA